MFTLTADAKEGLNAAQAARDDQAFARELRSFRPERVQGISDQDLAGLVTRARLKACDMGLMDPRLRARFVMIDILLVPQFWRDPKISRLLQSRSGPADARFGDVCAALKQACRGTGFEADIWW